MANNAAIHTIGIPGAAGQNAVVSVVVKTVTYLLTSADNATLFVMNSGSAQSFQLPATPPSNGWHVFLQNEGAGTCTVDRNGNTIDDAASNLTLTTAQGMLIGSNGSAYYTERGMGTGGGGGVTSLNSLTGALNITAGSGITVTPSGSNIQIAATGGSAFYQTVQLAGTPKTQRGVLNFSSSALFSATDNAGNNSTDINLVTDVANGVPTLDASALFKAAEFPAFTGDVAKIAGSLATKVTAIQNVAVSATAPTVVNQVLAWSGTQWAPTGVYGGVNSQTTTYAIVAGDNGKIISCSSATAFTVTLLNPPPTAIWNVTIKNLGTGVVTVSRNTLTIDAKASDLTLAQGDAVTIYTDGSNYFTGLPRPVTAVIFAPGLGTNAQVLLRVALGRTITFPANAPNAQATASANATASTTYTFKKGGVSFATVNFPLGSAAGTWTQASDAVFAATDVLEVDGPATADATLKDVGFSLQGYRF